MDNVSSVLWVVLIKTGCRDDDGTLVGAARSQRENAYLLEADFLGKRVAWMLGRTPPWATVTPPRNLLSSSSLRTASWIRT